MRESVAAPALVAVPSHGTHRKNMLRLLDALPEFADYRVVLVARTFAPLSVIRFRNWLRRGRGGESVTVLVSRSAENQVIDGFTERVTRWNANQVIKFVPDIRLIVFGETAGEVGLFAGQLASFTGAPTCLSPEGLGVLWQTREECNVQGVAWRNALRAPIEVARTRDGLRRGPVTFQFASRVVAKFWWRLRRLVFLLLFRPAAPRFLLDSHIDFLASDWLNEVPPGFSVGQTLRSPAAPRVAGERNPSSAGTAVFLHGPYDFDSAVWTACLGALDFSGIHTLIVKQHRNPLGFGALEAAARALPSDLKIEVLRTGNIEDLFLNARQSMVAGIDSSALFSARSMVPECRIVSVIPTLTKYLEARGVDRVETLRPQFELFLGVANAGGIEVI